jgi:hypothetical protein
MLTKVGILNYYTLQIRRKVCTTVSIMWENARVYIFAKTFAKIFEKIFAIFVHFRKKIFAKSEKKFLRKFRENEKTKIFVSTLVTTIAISQYRLLFGLFLLYTVFRLNCLTAQPSHEGRAAPEGGK